MAATLEYKCPCCGGAIAFDSGLQKMKCPYCDTELDVESLVSYDEELKQDAPDEWQWECQAAGAFSQQDADDVRVYICPSCGGEIVGDAHTAATKCPYCDNFVIIKEQLAGTLRPNWVIPFKFNKEAAREQFQRHLQKKRLLPRAFKDEAHLEEIQGVYVPFWLFDTDAQAHIRYRATRLRCWQDMHYEYTETQFFAVMREGSLGFERVPVDGSTRMPDDLMESLEPYDTAEAMDFQTAYLSGYLADSYDVTAEQCATRANERVKSTTESRFAATVNGYNTVTTEHSQIQLQNGKIHYALYPVWLLRTIWNDQTYLFAMNGQTGKFVGNLPMDGKAFAKWLLGLTAAIGAALFGFLSLIWWLRGGGSL